VKNAVEHNGAFASAARGIRRLPRTIANQRAISFYSVAAEAASTTTRSCTLVSNTDTRSKIVLRLNTSDGASSMGTSSAFQLRASLIPSAPIAMRDPPTANSAQEEKDFTRTLVPAPWERRPDYKNAPTKVKQFKKA